MTQPARHTQMKILPLILFAIWIVGQIFGASWPMVVPTAESFAQTSPPPQALIAGIRGVVTVIPGTGNRLGYAPQYRTSLAVGDVIATEEESVAELLLPENQGVVAIQEFSEMMLEEGQGGHSQLQLRVGAAEWSHPISEPLQTGLNFSTPNIRATTTGGLITAEVLPTLAETAGKSRPRSSYVVRTSLRAQSSLSDQVGLLETFCAKEGTLQLEYPGSQPGTWDEKQLEPGQCLGFFNGALRAIGDEYEITDWRAICAVGKHCDIPDSTKKLIKKKQMAQALALERALVGSDPVDGEVDEQIVLATTGQSLGASTQGPNPDNPATGGVVLPCTGNSQLCAAPDPNVGGTPPPTGGGGGGQPSPGNIQVSGALVPAGGVAGGLGLLTFLDSDFRAEKELLFADGGIKVNAPHVGKAPENSLVISTLAPTGAGSVSNETIPLQFSSFNQPLSSNVQIGTESNDRMRQAEQLAQFARSNGIDPDNILDSVPEAGAAEPCQTLLDCFEIILAQGKQGTFDSPDPDGGIDGSVQVRSSSAFDPGLGIPGATREVTLKGGVVLVNSQVAVGPQEQTTAMFSGTGAILGQEIQGAVVSLLGKANEPALVTLEDRALAVLDGSSIQPMDPAIPTALLAVLDSQLTGPSVPPVIGQDAGGNDILRQDVPAFIEVIDGTVSVDTAVLVGSTDLVANTVDLDQALLNASSPLLAMINGNLTTTSDFGRVAGQNAKFEGNLVAGDALIRLDGTSRLTVNGNLFHVSGGAQFTLANGSLLSVQGDSLVDINGGVLAAVGAGSTFSLSGGALVDFGTGTNVVNISNTLCASTSCFAPFSNPNWLVSGSDQNFSAPTDFQPFLDVGTFQDGSVNTVNVAPGSAILSVDSQGNISLQN